MLKKIFFKTGMLLFLLFLFNFIYTEWFYEKDIQKHSPIINLVRNIPDSADIIYIGESSNNTFRGNDLDKRPISAFIGDHFTELNTYDITKPASHAGIYKVLLDNIPESNKVKTIVVTLNLRSFNAQWIYSELETSLQKSIVLIKSYPPLFNRFLLSFKAYDIRTKDERAQQYKSKWKKDKFDMPADFKFKNVIEWDQWISKNGINDVNGNYNRAKTELASHYIKTYGFQIDTINNPRINDFNDIVELAQQRNWNLAFNLLAENTEKAKELVGSDLTYMINENAKTLEHYFTRRGVVVINNINEVEDEQFIDQNWTTEHYAEKGRKIIARNVAHSLKEWHADFYEEVNYDNKYQTTFFNDCDSNVIWGQMQTITTEEYYSGNKSSKTGEGNDFSITLEYPLKAIPDSLINTLNVEFRMLQNTLNHNAKLVLQASGNDFRHYWKGFDIKNSFKEINTWTKYNFNIVVPDSIKQADLVKVYIYNPSKEKVYIDDFQISFDE
jgi:hypothetical protein